MTAKVQDTAWYSYTSSTQTMKTWAKAIKSYEDIPSEFRAAFPEYEDIFPYTVFIPEDRLSLFHKRNGKMLCMYHDRFAVLEALRDRVKTFSAPFTDILYIEQGRILLHSWLTVKTLSGAFFVKFNTTNIQYFTPIIEKMRQGMSLSPVQAQSSKENEQERAKFNYLNTLNYKYMNFGRQSMCPGDTVRNILYQPARCIQRVTFLKRVLFRRFATSHLSILTDREIILIKENKRTKADGKNLYGGVFTYISLKKIQSLSLKSPVDESSTTLEISLPGGICRHSEFAHDREGLTEFLEAWRAVKA